MKNTYAITTINHKEQKQNSYGYNYNISPTIFRNGFDEVVKFLGGKPKRERCGWSCIKGNTEYIITRV